MRDFAGLAEQAHAHFPMAAELWTLYHLEMNPYPRCRSDWGMCSAYHFDRGVSIEPWLGLVARVRGWVESRPALRQIIQFVPFYEVGTDFFAQCKPPYDGGYSTAHYEEFLFYGSCEPAPWFFEQLAGLHRQVAEEVRSISAAPAGALLKRVVHATFIQPNSHLFWRDEAGWVVYQPSITTEDIRKWVSLSEVKGVTTDLNAAPDPAA